MSSMKKKLVKGAKTLALAGAAVEGVALVGVYTPFLVRETYGGGKKAVRWLKGKVSSVTSKAKKKAKKVRAKAKVKKAEKKAEKAKAATKAKRGATKSGTRAAA